MKILVFGGGSDIAKAIPTVAKDVVLVGHHECDIKTPEDVASFIKRHHPDVVINCAGTLKGGLVGEQKLSDWSEQIDTNLIGSFCIAQSSVKNSVKTIIFIGSGAGLYGKATYSAYSASKAGVISL